MILLNPINNNLNRKQHSCFGTNFKSRDVFACFNSMRRLDVDTFQYSFDKVCDRGLASYEKDDIKLQLKKIDNDLKNLEEKKLYLERLLDYDKLRQNGFEAFAVRRFVNEDNLSIKKAQDYLDKNKILRERMFGYPANLTEDSAVTKYLRKKENELPLTNNCGDPFDSGNYLMDSKEYEIAILNKLFEHFGLDLSKKPWGYITTGGSESNKWGIYNGLRKFPEGRVYYSDSAHYSVPKAVKLGFDKSDNDITLIKHTNIQAKNNSEKIDTDMLLFEIRKNWDINKEPAIILLTLGTTKTGAVDDIELISKTLKSENIPHYIHLDAALYGGIAKNQINAPTVPNIEYLGVDSVSVSLHKYFGNHDVKSVVISKEPPVASKVDYIGQIDSTTAGSRTFNPFSSLQRITETLDRKFPNEYCENVLFFENLLKEKNIKFTREENANIFVLDKPSDEICKKYQLSTFDDNGVEKCHVIIFPYHKKEMMSQLINEIKF